jgi:SAM-dependent methyltransferase
MSTVVQYYDRIADEYDHSRFSHTWGRCLDHQERQLLERWLPSAETHDILDLGCGTGRMLDLATAGVDASANMVSVARSTNPSSPVDCAMAHELPYRDASFDAVFSLHLAMHLNPRYLERVLHECHRVLRPGGRLIFDAPSDLRRRLNAYEPDGWHCATVMNPWGVRQRAADLFEWEDFRGVMFAPFHRLPDALSRMLVRIDAAVGRHDVGRWACSHYMFCLRRRDA